MYNDDNNAKKIFYQDSFEKKKNGRGIYSRASRRGYIKGGVKTAYDYLTTKERKQLNGEIKVSNVYENVENIPTLQELEKKDEKAIKFILETILKHHTPKVLREKLKISNLKMYSLFNKYGVNYGKDTLGSTTNTFADMISSEAKASLEKIAQAPISDKDVEEPKNEVVIDVVEDKKPLKSKNKVVEDNSTVKPKLRSQKAYYKGLVGTERGEFINKLRVQGYTNEEIGDAIGIKKSSVSTYLNAWKRENKIRESSKLDKIYDKLKDDSTSIENSKDETENNDAFEQISLSESPISDIEESIPVIESQKLDPINVSIATKSYEAEILNKQSDEIAKLKATIDLLNKQLEEANKFKGINLAFKGDYSGNYIKEKMLDMVNILGDEVLYTIDFNVKEYCDSKTFGTLEPKED